MEHALKAVVTGGAGFIGSHLCNRLVETGYEVVVVDDLSTGKEGNIAHLADNPRFTFMRGSVLDRELLSQAFDGATYVFHQAAIASVPRSISDPMGTHDVNVTGTLRVLEAARDAKVSKVVLASSAAIYGDNPTLPLNEDTPASPLSPYAAQKASAEAYCAAFAQAYGLPTVALRYFNVYGPRQDPESEYAAVIPKFISAALEGRPLTIYGDGEQTRDFVYVGDVAKANMLAATSNARGVLNIAGGDSITIRELAQSIVSAANSTSQICHAPARTGDIEHSRADITHSLEAGWSPTTPLRSGLKHIFDRMSAPQ